MSDKPNCYDCIYRGNVPGDTHSCCRYPGNDIGMISGLLNKKNTENAHKLNIKYNFHARVKGWFFWPINFDPVWLLNCDGFTPKVLFERIPKVFEMNEYDWWVDFSKKEANENYKKWQLGVVGLSIEECNDDEARELTENEMTTLLYAADCDSPHSEIVKITFAEQLQRIIKKCEKLPCVFASTEY